MLLKEREVTQRTAPTDKIGKQRDVQLRNPLEKVKHYLGATGFLQVIENEDQSTTRSCKVKQQEVSPGLPRNPVEKGVHQKEATWFLRITENENRSTSKFFKEKRAAGFRVPLDSSSNKRLKLNVNENAKPPRTVGRA